MIYWAYINYYGYKYLSNFCHNLCKLKFLLHSGSLQWSDFGKGVRSPTKCTILVRIWWDFQVFGEIWKKLVEILRLIFMTVYNISLSTIEYSAFSPCAAINFNKVYNWCSSTKQQMADGFSWLSISTMICEYLCAAGSNLWLMVGISFKTGQKKGGNSL